MRQTFYKHASSKAETPSIDKHLIHSSLDGLSYYWAGAESAFLVVLAAIIYFWLGHFKASSALLLVAGIILTVMHILWKGCVNRALRQAEEITSDTNRANEIKKVFDAL